MCTQCISCAAQSPKAFESIIRIITCFAWQVKALLVLVRRASLDQHGQTSQTRGTGPLLFDTANYLGGICGYSLSYHQ